MVLDRGKISNICRIIDEQKDDARKFFQEMNKYSVKLCGTGNIEKGSKEYYEVLRKMLPDNIGYRKLAKKTGVSHQQIKKWGEEYKEGDNDGDKNAA